METGERTATRGSDRLLRAIIAGAVLLVVAGFALLFMVRDRQPQQFPEDTPQGVVQRYLQAENEGRYTDAEQYISDSVKNRYPKGIPSRPPIPPSGSYRVVLQDTKIDGDNAHVTVAISRFQPGGGGPFGAGSSEYTNSYVFELKRENGVWRILSPDYPLMY